MHLLEDTLLVAHGDGSLAHRSVAAEHQFNCLLGRSRLLQHLQILVLALNFLLAPSATHSINYNPSPSQNTPPIINLMKSPR